MKRPNLDDLRFRANELVKICSEIYEDTASQSAGELLVSARIVVGKVDVLEETLRDKSCARCFQPLQRGAAVALCRPCYERPAVGELI